MPRTTKYPSDGVPVLIPAGTYEYNVNGFNSNNTSFLVIAIERVAWPLTTSDVVMRVTLLWNTGGGASFTTTGGLALDRNGQPLLTQRFRVGVPNVSDGNGGKVKKPVSAATATVEILEALTTAFTVTAE